jgi:putative inorganic carbon (hco3(-)) transporter
MSSGGPETLRADPRQLPAAAAVPAAVLLTVAVLLLPVALAIGLATTSELKVVAAVGAVLGGLVILARPYWGLVLFVALLYVRPEEVVPELAGMRLALAISLVTLAGAWLQTFLRREGVVRTPLNEMIVLFGLAGVASTATLGNSPEAAQDFGKLVLLVLLILNLVREPEKYRTFVTALLVFTGYLAVYSTYRYFTGGALDYQGLERSQGTGIFGDPNDLAGTLAPGVALVASRLPPSRGGGRFGYICLGLLFLGAIMLTSSRSGMIALVAVVLGIPIIMSRYRGLAIAFAVVMALALLVLGPSRMTQFDATEASANERFWYWSDGIGQMMSNPVLGLGYGQFPEVNWGRTAHNSFVLCFVELGLVGYFFWMGCLYYCFRPRPKADGTEPLPETSRYDLMGARLALVGFLVSGFFLSRTYIPVLYVLLALPVACQVAAYGRGAALRLTGAERLADWTRIAVLCGFSIVGIKLIADFYK